MTTLAYEPIQTEYSGITFRSRSEAMIARLLDTLSYDWVYEPWFLDGWVPDFVIAGKIGIDARVAECIQDFLPLEMYERAFQIPLGLSEIWLMPNSPIPSSESQSIACWGWRLKPDGQVSELQFTINEQRLTYLDALCYRKEIWLGVMREVWLDD